MSTTEHVFDISINFVGNKVMDAFKSFFLPRDKVWDFSNEKFDTCLVYLIYFCCFLFETLFEALNKYFLELSLIERGYEHTNNLRIRYKFKLIKFLHIVLFYLHNIWRPHRKDIASPSFFIFWLYDIWWLKGLDLNIK